LVLFFLSALAASSVAIGAETPTGVPAGYERRTLEGFTLYVNKNVLARNTDRYGRQPLSVLERELNDLRRILVKRIVSVLQEVPIWVEWDATVSDTPGVVARYWQASAEEMRKHGGDPRKAGTVEVLTLKRLGELRHPGSALQQIIILHEMAHAVHHRLLGRDNPELEATFKQATDRKLYDEVNDRFGRRGKAYARTNAAEYFAELSCAYLDSCNYFPFNNQQLKGYDPVGYKFVERVWTQPERFATIAHKTKAGVPAGLAPESEAFSPVRTDARAERDALLKLDKLKAQLRNGQKDQAKKELQALLKMFPHTEAAIEARQLLKKLS
jgi:hypothetical protein